MQNDNEKQHERFKEAARQLETDDDEAAFNAKLGKLVKRKSDDQGDVPGNND